MVQDPPQTGWHNWSHSVVVRNARVLRPRSTAELVGVIQQARTLRPVGAGHSFMPLCDSDDVLVDLSDLEGTIEIAPDRKSAWVPAGWSIARLTEALWQRGLSLANQGDVNPQSLAGAISTGTHGTGVALGSLSTFVRGVRLITTAGDIITCNAAQHPEIFEAARLSLGLIGIIIAIDVALVPAYGLVEQVDIVDGETLCRDFAAMVEGDRHGEFFIFPYANQGFLKRLHLIPMPEDHGTSTDFDEEHIFAAAVKWGGRFPFLIAPSQRAMMRFSKPTTRQGPAFRIFPSDRNVRFEEMEYHFPQGAGLPALREAMALIRKRRLPVTFPFEFRQVAGDDIWLSPFKAAVNQSVAFHMGHLQYDATVFRAIEDIFRQAGGRPHWAKRHTLTRADVDVLYPQAEQFRTVRRQLDPMGKFLNPHLAALFS